MGDFVADMPESSVGAAHGFIPFESGPKHPFVGEAAHVAGQGPLPVTAGIKAGECTLS